MAKTTKPRSRRKLKNVDKDKLYESSKQFVETVIVTVKRIIDVACDMSKELELAKESVLDKYFSRSDLFRMTEGLEELMPIINDLRSSFIDREIKVSIPNPMDLFRCETCGE